MVYNVELFCFLQITNRKGTESHPVIKSTGPNRQLSVVLVMVPVSNNMLAVFAILGMWYAVRSNISASGDLIMNIPRISCAVKPASTNPYWYQLPLVCYNSTTTGGFHYTSPSAKPATTGSVQVVCASSQWDAYLTTYSERMFTRDYFVDGTLGKLFRGGTGHNAHQPLGTACKELLVLRGGPAQQFSLS